MAASRRHQIAGMAQAVEQVLVQTFVEHTAEFGPPFVEGSIADAMLAAQLFRAKPSLMLFQYPDDLFFREPRSLHRLSPLIGTD